jgi:hypothetical protein
MSSSKPITLLESGVTVAWMANYIKADPAVIQAAVEKEIADIHAAPGLEVTVAWLDPEDESSIAKFKEQVVNGPNGQNKYDGIGIGWGARSVPELTTMFEDLVNFCEK